MLINYRLNPAVARPLLPSALRPQLVGGRAVAGIYLLRLGAMRSVQPGRAPRSDRLVAHAQWTLPAEPADRAGPCRAVQGLQSLQLATDKLAGEAGKALEE